MHLLKKKTILNLLVTTVCTSVGQMFDLQSNPKFH